MTEEGSTARVRSVQLAQLFHDATLPIILEDLQGVVTDMNPAAEESYGWSRAELVGKPIKTIVPKRFHGQADQMLTDCREGRMVKNIETVRQDRAGREIPVLVTLSLLTDDKGRPSRIATMATDIENLKAAEKELLIYRDRLEQRVAERTQELESALYDLKTARAEAVEANRAKSEFLANMSHEIRTPMNAILGLAHLLLETDINQKQRHYLERIEGGAKSLLGIVNDILDFSKIEARKLVLERTDFELERLLDQLRDLFGLPAAKKGVELLFRLEKDVPAVIQGDPLRLGQVLNNLVSNALKFTEEGQVLVQICITEEGGIRFEVHDTGVGISREQMDHLFQSFSQADTSTTRKYGGTGLGLAICEQLVSLMEGKIGAESESGEGSCFWFEVNLPFKLDERTPRELPVDLNVLLVDENRTARELTRNILEEFGYQVAAAECGETALRSFQERGDFDMLLLNLEMSSSGGLSAVRSITEESEARPRLVGLTYYVDPDSRVTDTREEFDAVVIKPITRISLRESIVAAFQEPTKLTTSPPKRSNESRVKLRDSRILLVEDNDTNREIAQEILRLGGLDVSVAANGLEAVERVSAEHFDGVLMDLQMPVMDGITATRKIRELGYSMPIIAVTANALPEEKKRCFDVGMDGLVTKPLDVELLFSMMARFIVPHKVLDMEAALQVMGGNESLFHRLTQEFLEKHQDIAGTLSYEDLKTARREAHSIAGSSAFLGMPRVQTLAKELERLCVENAPGRRLKEKATELQEAVDEVRAVYRCRRQRNSPSQAITPAAKPPVEDSPPSTRPPEIESEAESTRLQLLREYLRAGDVRCEEVLRDLKAELPENHNPVWDEVSDLVEDLNFDRALELLTSKNY